MSRGKDDPWPPVEVLVRKWQWVAGSVLVMVGGVSAWFFLLLIMMHTIPVPEHSIIGYAEMAILAILDVAVSACIIGIGLLGLDIWRLHNLKRGTWPDWIIRFFVAF